MSAKISTEHATKHVETRRVHPSDLKRGRNSRMIPAVNYQQTVTDRAISIAKSGQLQPCEARRLEDKTLELTYGFTRFDAVVLLRNGFTATDPDSGETATFHDPEATVWVKIVDTDADSAFLRSISENQERKDTTDLQEALAQNELRTTRGWTDTKIARFYGYSNQNRVMTLEKLLRTPASTQEAVHEGRLALSNAILGVDHGLSAEEQAKLIEESNTDGKVSGPALKALLRGMVESKAAPAEEPAEEKSEPKAPSIKRSAKDLERFFEQMKADESTLSDNGAELLGVLVQWFKGRRTDDYLRSAINEYTE